MVKICCDIFAAFLNNLNGTLQEVLVNHKLVFGILVSLEMKNIHKEFNSASAGSAFLIKGFC